jgi:2-C-methyl-D-erythritol 4-phosphate cytidylyltransferase
MSAAAAILLCAGKGERLGAGMEKALVRVAGRPLFLWSLEAFVHTPAVESIVLVGPVKKLRAAAEVDGLPLAKVVAWCEGGRERQHSVDAGLKALPQGPALVAVHDSARALITPALIARVLGDAHTHGAAIAAMPLEDTLKRGRLGAIEQTIPRANLWRAQTPQVFRRDWLEAAHAAASAIATDDAALLEAQGQRVHLTEGDAMNFKITTPADLALAEACLAARAARGAAPSTGTSR